MMASGLSLFSSGKVREIYEVGHDRLLIVTSDRISAFDVVLDDLIPQKGHVLTGLSTFWFDLTHDIVANHMISSDPTDLPEAAGSEVAGRSMLVHRAQPVKMECVVRGYMAGSAWQEYIHRGTVNGMRMSTGLEEGELLMEPIFTPTTKADTGHDVALTPLEAIDLVGGPRYVELRDLSLALYDTAVDYGRGCGIIIADTKLEFGEVDGKLVLIDEAFTPDSSRFWPIDMYKVGRGQPSFDKQYVRDYLDSTGWNHEPPVPRLPAEVIEGTRARYIEAYERLTRKSFGSWFGVDG